MEKNSLKCPEIEPFEFQSRTAYRDSLRLLNTIRELHGKGQSDLAKTFIKDLFEAAYAISKNLAHASFFEKHPLKMDMISSGIAFTVDSITALEVCLEARWISSIQYFESKQILEKLYWYLREEQRLSQVHFQSEHPIQSFENHKQFQ